MFRDLHFPTPVYVADLNDNNLKFKQIKVDSIDVSNHSKLAEKYINKKFLDNSNYYKNLIVKVRDFKDFS